MVSPWATLAVPFTIAILPFPVIVTGTAMLIASEASNLCLRVEPGDQINANSFPHFQLGGKDAALCAL